MIDREIKGKDEKIGNLLKTLKVKKWTATEEQLNYTVADDLYILGQITVYAGGTPQATGINFTEDSPTSFILLCGGSEIPAGIEIIAVYR
ncbi:hypothetical protein [Aneurinibacillus tyrosinisolvens]|uniref:hypothetical protein n=1 Tax=Aneurinibacillus tyrosinisolvens TaxID=1443435 RepID=UPI00063EE425|nr:hypothetical protein [Aneurinibacillus tyrosinisolvens]